MDIIDNQSASNLPSKQATRNNDDDDDDGGGSGSKSSNLKLISVGNTAEGLGIKLSKSSWDPYPFVSFVDEARVQQHDLQIGDCLLKV
jgi:hypothetical protein